MKQRRGVLVKSMKRKKSTSRWTPILREMKMKKSVNIFMKNIKKITNSQIAKLKTSIYKTKK